MSLERLDTVLETRRSIREFRPVGMSRKEVEDILHLAGYAPSNSNTQPWKVDILSGEAKSRLTAAIMKEHERNPTMPSEHFPKSLPDECLERQANFGRLFYGAYGIPPTDTHATERQLILNYDFYGAPVGMIISIDSVLRKHSWLDCGLFLQSLLLVATARGFGACAQVVFAGHEDTIKSELGLPEDRSVICGVSLGVPKGDAAINNVTYPRKPLDEYCTFRGFNDGLD